MLAPHLKEPDSRMTQCTYALGQLNYSLARKAISLIIPNQFTVPLQLKIASAAALLRSVQQLHLYHEFVSWVAVPELSTLLVAFPHRC